MYQKDLHLSTAIYTFPMSEKARPRFAVNLIALRKSKGVSQRDLAEKSGISQRMIAYYETTAVIPPIEKLERLANALGASVADLVDQTDAPHETLGLNTRTLKKVQLIEQLPPEDQRKVMDYVKDLLERNSLKKGQEAQKADNS